ncbi:Met-10+ like-protein-domain-containing protein [Gautieria morchelliformis]|nr:Met-10+ like-protein-domain-containing protein [Gautieria morchelliformis]
MLSQGIPPIDISPPIVSSLKVFDRSQFYREIPVLAVRVTPVKAGLFLKAPAMKGSLLQLPKVKSIISDQKQPDERLVLLGTVEEALLPSIAREFVAQEGLGLVQHVVKLDYTYWTTDEILDAILPPGLPEGTPTSFSTAGHLAHVNLRDEYLPYKHIIGQVILDKNPNIRTVVNKLNNIHSQFRFFEMELLAGEADYVVDVSESGCRFTFDFTTVYWNSRLHHEHERLVSLFNPGEVIADIFAGVGPFALPAAKRGCVVFANDLNPESVRWMRKNVERNHVQDHVRVFCEDGMAFIKQAVRQSWDNPFPQLGPLKSANQRAREARRRPPGRGSSLFKGTRRISHFVMNLPDSAITFLGAFRGLFTEIREHPDFETVYHEKPMVHCYCFTRELEPDRAEKDIRERVSTSLGHQMTGSESIHLVRRVAPNKDMYCISFRLPNEIVL